MNPAASSVAVRAVQIAYCAGVVGLNQPCRGKIATEASSAPAAS